MKFLEDIIREKGVVKRDYTLSVDSFLYDMIDTDLMHRVGQEFAERFRDDLPTKILTIETSGIAPAVFAGYQLNIPVVFARKNPNTTLDANLYESNVYSYTDMNYYTISVPRKFISSKDRILIIDDFLSNGQAVLGLCEIVKTAKGILTGVGVVIEKSFKGGGDSIRNEGIRVESLAIVDKLSEKQIVFKKEEDEK